jgi:hypothetical protein
MKAGRLITSVVALGALTVIVTSATLGRSQRVQKQNDDDQKSRIERGFQMAPVPLNLEGKNRELVGLGSYPSMLWRRVMIVTQLVPRPSVHQAETPSSASRPRSIRQHI